MLPPPWRAFYFLSCIRLHRGRTGSLQQAFGWSMGNPTARERRAENRKLSFSAGQINTVAALIAYEPVKRRFVGSFRVMKFIIRQPNHLTHGETALHMGNAATEQTR